MQLDDIKRVGVVGSGTMGFGIAVNFALGGYPTLINDLNDAVLAKSAGSGVYSVVEGALQMKYPSE